MALSLKELEEHLLIGSTLVEGSTLSEDEARAVLAGWTVSGHSVDEVRELVAYRAATEWLLARVASVPFLSLDLVLGFHQRLMAGSVAAGGSFKSRANYTRRTDGTRHDYVHPAHVDDAMREWIAEFNADAEDAVTRAAALYARFQQIHPFDDGNGRVGRLVIAYWLYWKHGLLFRFYAADKLDHLRAIEQTDEGRDELVVAFFRARVKAP